jgi:hypothetical protein
MKNVALVALLSAPAALAFIPADLSGTWSCVPLDGEFFTTGQTSSKDIVWSEVSDTYSHRAIVFDKADSKDTRFISGRSYFTVGTQTEEHSFHGSFHNALQADFHFDPNKYNAECQESTATHLSDLNPKIGSNRYNSTATGNWNGSCLDHSSGAYRMNMEDADHFTLQLDPKDQSLKYHYTGTTVYPHVFVIEKCMRGLPEKNDMCDDLKHSSIDTSSEMNDACQGTLICSDIDSSDSSKGKQCSIPPTPAPVSYVPQPYYQPQYYQPQYYQPQYYQPQYQPQYFQAQSSNIWG